MAFEQYQNIVDRLGLIHQLLTDDINKRKLGLKASVDDVSQISSDLDKFSRDLRPVIESLEVAPPNSAQAFLHVIGKTPGPTNNDTVTNEFNIKLRPEDIPKVSRMVEVLRMYQSEPETKSELPEALTKHWRDEHSYLNAMTNESEITVSDIEIHFGTDRFMYSEDRESIVENLGKMY